MVFTPAQASASDLWPQRGDIVVFKFSHIGIVAVVNSTGGRNFTSVEGNSNAEGGADGYAVVKHRVMELPVLLRRSARYLLVRRGAVTVAIFLGTVTTIVFAQLLSQVFGEAGASSSATLVAGSVFGGMLAFAGQRAWRRTGDRIDRAFFRGAYDAKRLLEQLATESRMATDRDALAATLERTIREALHPRVLLVYLLDESARRLQAQAVLRYHHVMRRIGLLGFAE